MSTCTELSPERKWIHEERNKLHARPRVRLQTGRLAPNAGTAVAHPVPSDTQKVIWRLHSRWSPLPNSVPKSPSTARVGMFQAHTRLSKSQVSACADPMRSFGEWHPSKEGGQGEGQNSAVARWGLSPGWPTESSLGRQTRSPRSAQPPNPNGGQGFGLLDLRHSLVPPL